MRRLIFSALPMVSMAALSYAADAQAQQATPVVAAPVNAEAEADVIAIDDIIVTANRTQSSAQDTPIALNAYTGEALRDQGVTSVRDLSLIDPSVNVSNTGGAAYIAVRGIASTDYTEIGDPSVPVSRDGFYTNRSFSINSSMYDVARIEVLKGPQGTLNGRNSTGGLINIITNRPAMRNEGYASVDGGNYGTFIAEAGANIMLTEGLAVRASGVFNSHDGYRNLDGPGQYGDDENFASGRLQAQYNSGGLSLWASYQHDSRDVNGDAVLRSQLAGPRPPFDDVDNFPNSVPIYTELAGDRVRWEVAYDGLAGLNFVYAGGYDKQEFRNAIDLTGSYPANRQFLQQENPETYNHEFRVSNEEGGRLFFQAGYFRFHENNTLNSGLFNREATGPFAIGGSLAALGQSNVYGIAFNYDIETTSQAVFGQADYQLTSQLELTVGARYTWDKKLRTGQAVLFLPALASPFAPPLTIVNPGDGSLDDSEPTWHLGLNYRPAAGSLIYVKYDRGYKSGGFNSNGSAASVDYGAETLDAYEVGTKNSLLDNRLRLNLSAFYFDYQGYQATQATTILGGGSGIFNVGNARIMGLEAEVVAQLASRTRAHLNASVLDTRFGDNVFVRDGSGSTADIGGNDLPNAPSFTASAGLEQGFDVAGGELIARVDARYSSNFYYSVFNQSDTESDSYVITNGSLKYSPAGTDWDFQLYVRNAFDENILAYASRNFVSNLNNYQFQPPRTFGVRISTRF